MIVTIIDDFMPIIDGEPAMCRCNNRAAHLYYKAAAKVANSFAGLQMCASVAPAPDGKESALSAAMAPAVALRNLLGIAADSSLSGAAPALQSTERLSETRDLEHPEIDSFQIVSAPRFVGIPHLEFSVGGSEGGVVQIIAEVQWVEHNQGNEFNLCLAEVVNQTWELVHTQAGLGDATLVYNLRPGKYVAFVAAHAAIARGVSFKVDSEVEILNAQVVEAEETS